MENGKDVKNNLQKDESTESKEGMKKCLYCAEWINVEAIKCRYCNSDLEKPIKNKDEHNNGGGMSAGRVMFIIGSILILVSMLLPFLEIDRENFKLLGYETDGIFIGVLGVAALVIGLTYNASKSSKSYSIVGFFIALICLAFTIYIYMNHLTNCMDKSLSWGISYSECSTFVGIGIFVAFLGSILLLIGSLSIGKNREVKV